MVCCKSQKQTSSGVAKTSLCENCLNKVIKGWKMNNFTSLILMKSAAQNCPHHGRWMEAEGIMESRANERKKHAIVYLLGAPLVFWAQLLQKKQINYPERWGTERTRVTHDRWKTEQQRRHQQQVSWSAPREVFTSLFVGEGQVQIHVPPPALQIGF